MDIRIEGSLKTTLAFALPDGSEKAYSQSFTLPRVSAESGPELLSAQLFAEVEKELRFGAYWDALADLQDLLRSVPRKISANDLWMGKELSVHNTREVWREVTNALLGAKYLLAQARAFRDVKAQVRPADTDENTASNVHLSMLESFDHAVYLLAKVEDLFLLLLFVNLWTTSSSIVDVDLSSSDWDKAVDWKSVRKGLAERSRFPADVTDAEHDAILKVFNSYQRTGALERIANYRNRVTHTIHPSVDDPKFSASLCFPKQIPNGGVDMSIRWPAQAEFQFLELYADAAEALTRVVTLLRELKRIERFA
jgi:hypothetical protein